MKINRTFAEINLSNLNKNYLDLYKRASKNEDLAIGVLPMVKANAYGHGAIEVSKSIESRFYNKSLTGFGVATFNEAISLRSNGIQSPIWIFLDTSPFSEERKDMCLKYGFHPVIHRKEDLSWILNRKVNGLKFHLKFNSGMNRLGLELSDLERIKALLKKKQIRPEGVCSHLAAAESPNHRHTINQIEKSLWMVKEFLGLGIRYRHLLNSEGIINKNSLIEPGIFNVVRPGIGLYGYSSSSSTLTPVMKWKAQVVSERVLEIGEYVGYGINNRLTSRVNQRVLSVGYADGLSRRLSQKELYLDDKKTKTPVLGLVSMDSTSIKSSAKLLSWVTILGASRKQAEWMAKVSNTNVYEVLTSVCWQRVPRFFK